VGHAVEDNAKKGSASVDISQLLRLCVESHASDLHLSAGLPPMLRVHGELRRTELPALSDQEIRTLLEATMAPAQRDAYAAQWELDYACVGPDTNRFRVNAFTQLHGAGAVFRCIPSEILTLEQLGVPEIFSQLALKPQGLVLVTGPTGSGKSTTLAALTNHRNAHHRGHIVTIEDPIEFVHGSQKSLVHQREVGTHTHGFSQALRSALREDPDAIVIGELRDLETIRLALTAAETGHLVLASLHTASAAKTIDRIVDVFPGDERNMVRTMLSESLLAVISQTLCTTPTGDGRLAAFEILVGTPAVRNLIREGKIAQLYSAMQTGSGAGMQTLDQHLMALVRAQRISLDVARSNAKMPENF
jgi:twitching motility protein PilT